MIRNLAPLLLVLCFVADYVALVLWVDRNVAKAGGRWQLSLRGVLVLVAVFSVQLLVVFAYLHGR